MARKREEAGYRNSQSKNGFSPHISNSLAQRIILYCRETNQNKTRFVEKCVSEKLDQLERELFSNKTKEELIEIILAHKTIGAGERRE